MPLRWKASWAPGRKHSSKTILYEIFFRVFEKIPLVRPFTVMSPAPCSKGL